MKRLFYVCYDDEYYPKIKEADYNRHEWNTGNSFAKAKRELRKHIKSQIDHWKAYAIEVRKVKRK